ncbi:MAG: hypothetical protein M1813_008265 [Trichoglossum hirsutum]|nr:MAG: hypothetical protein M1813_008265 [Trichoglossum hirsutum]
MTAKSEPVATDDDSRNPEMPVDSNQTPKERVQSLLDSWAAEGYGVKRAPSKCISYHIFLHANDWRSPQGFDLDLVKNRLHLVSATAEPAAAATYAFTVTEPFCNRLGALHGGAAALIFDICTSTTIAVSTPRGFWTVPSVSRTLNVTYLRPAPRGTECLIECEMVHSGKRLCECD